MSLKTIVEIGELLDFYGVLLTGRQREYMELYYNENLTLAEIAGHFSISRQAVHDTMGHAEEQLRAYEAKLQLFQKRMERMKLAEEILQRLPQEDRDWLGPMLTRITE